MAELKTTEEEKEAKTYLDWDNEDIGKMVKYIASEIDDKYGTDSVLLKKCFTLIISIITSRDMVNVKYTAGSIKTADGRKLGDWIIDIYPQIDKETEFKTCPKCNGRGYKEKIRSKIKRYWKAFKGAIKRMKQQYY